MTTNDKNRVLNLGVVGMGLGTALMLPAVVAHPRFAVAGAYSRRADVRDDFERTFEAPAFDSLEALCESPAIDAVYIATPLFLHKQQALTALERGKHVIVEKPLAMTLDECDELAAAAAKSGAALVCGETHALIPTYPKMREIVASGELGNLGMINSWYYGDFAYRPRRPEELDPATGGGAVLNQGSHQADIVRLIGGGLVRSVRAYTGVWDASRRMEGAYLAYVEFENGAAASMTFSGYDHFDSDELHFWIGEGGAAKPQDKHGATQRALAEVGGPEGETARRAAVSFKAFLNQDRSALHMPHHGIVIASCERGDIRCGQDGLIVYDEEGAHDVEVASSSAYPGRTQTLDELLHAVVDGTPPLHGAAWSKATLELLLAIRQSSAERREISLLHQTAVPE